MFDVTHVIYKPALNICSSTIIKHPVSTISWFNDAKYRGFEKKRFIGITTIINPRLALKNCVWSLSCGLTIQVVDLTAITFLFQFLNTFSTSYDMFYHIKTKDQHNALCWRHTVPNLKADGHTKSTRKWAFARTSVIFFCMRMFFASITKLLPKPGKYNRRSHDE